MPPKKHATNEPANEKQAKKAKTAMPEMQKTPHASDVPGWCSDPRRKMSAEAIYAIDNGAGHELRESDLYSHEGTAQYLASKQPSDDRALVQYLEKDLVADPKEGSTMSRFWMVEDAQAHMTKYGHAKFGTRLVAMHTAIKSIDIQCSAVPKFDYGSACDCSERITVLLLGAKQPICRSNAIPELVNAGIVIQRREE